MTLLVAHPNEVHPSSGRFAPTSLMQLKCPRLYYLSQWLDLIPVEHNAALSFGTALHEGVAFFYKNSKMPFKERQALAVRAFAQTWSDFHIKGDSKRNMDVGIILMAKYCERYRSDNAAYNPDFIETIQWIEMPNGTMLGGVIDRVETDHDIIITDTKSSSWPLTEYWFQQYENDFQLSMYHHICETIFGHCTNVKIDAVFVPITTDPEKQFIRRSFYRNELQMADALNTYMRKTAFIMEAAEMEEEERLLHFYQEQTMCKEYGGCKYLPICKHGFNHPKVQTSFVKKEKPEDKELSAAE